MSQYGIVKPCAIVVDGKAIAYRKVGAIVEIDDSVAERLADSLYRIGGPYPKPSTAVPQLPAPEVQPADPEPETPSEPEAPVEPEIADEPEVEPVPEPLDSPVDPEPQRPKRRGKAADAD